jgi:hypothetical protein
MYPHFQFVTKVPGKNVWVELWSYSDWFSPIWPAFLTRVGGQVNVWGEQPPIRSKPSLLVKIICSIPIINFFCWLVHSIRSLGDNTKRYNGREAVHIILTNSYYDEAGIFLKESRKECSFSHGVSPFSTNQNPCDEHEFAFGFGFVKYPDIGPSIVEIVRSEALVSIGADSVAMQRTWDGPMAPP